MAKEAKLLMVAVAIAEEEVVVHGHWRPPVHKLEVTTNEEA